MQSLFQAWQINVHCCRDGTGLQVRAAGVPRFAVLAMMLHTLAVNICSWGALQQQARIPTNASVHHLVATGLPAQAKTLKSVLQLAHRCMPSRPEKETGNSSRSTFRPLWCHSAPSVSVRIHVYVKTHPDRQAAARQHITLRQE